MFVLEDIVKLFSVDKIIGNNKVKIKNLVELKNYTSDPSDLTWSNDKNLFKLEAFKSGTFICSPKVLENKLNENLTYIITEKPRKLFQDILTKYFYLPPVLGNISADARIHPSVKLGKNCSIGSGTIIEENCEIGDNSFIGYNNVILKNTKISQQVFIGNNNTIGAAGFGYEKDENGDFILIPHIGNVVIRKGVEVGNNTCIDRAVLGSTIIGENCKIDNLVHIAHGVDLGRNSMVIANAMVAGSVKTGENVWIAPSANIMNGTEIGENSTIGLGAVILKSVEANSIMVGNPARNLRNQSPNK